MKNLHKHIRFFGLTVLAFAALLSTRHAAAQMRDDYKTEAPSAALYIAPNEPKDKEKAKKVLIRDWQNKIRGWLRSPAALAAADIKRFDDWFLKYHFPMMTLSNPEGLKGITEERKNLRDMLVQSDNQALHDALVAHAFREFSRIAQEDYHPAVRVNAMLIVGELNQREMVRSGGSAAAPDPLLQALTYMLDQFESKDQIDAVRIAALVGILRHAQIDAQNQESKAEAARISPATQKRMTDLMLTLVRTPEAPAGRSSDGHHWMRRRAVEILGWIASGKLDQTIVDEIIARVGDSDEHRGVRCEAALALGRVMYLPDVQKPGAGNKAVTVKTPAVARDLARFVTEMASRDLGSVQAYMSGLEDASLIYGTATQSGYSGMESRTSRRTRGPQMSYPGALGGVGAKALPPDPYAFRLEPVYRKLRYEFGCVMNGLKGNDEFRKGNTTAGIYASIADGSKSAAAEREFIDTLGRTLQDFVVKLKLKEEELYVETFEDQVTEFLGTMNKTYKVAVSLPIKKKPGAIDPLAVATDPEDSGDTTKPDKAKPKLPAGDDPAEVPTDVPADDPAAEAGAEVPAEVPPAAEVPADAPPAATAPAAKGTPPPKGKAKPVAPAAPPDLPADE